ncbi:MAG: hypothetical protein R3A44_15645 [Caldilineaceae bacterium]
MDLRFLAKDSNWAAELERLYTALGAPHNVRLLPRHFTEAVLPKLGGKIALLYGEGQELGVGFLFPRSPHASPVTFAPGKAESAAYTLRVHWLRDALPHPPAAFLHLFAQHLPNATIFYYEPSAAHTYTATHRPFGKVDIGHPGADEVEPIRQAHQQIWGSPPESLYPVDMYSDEFGLGTALTARVEGAVAGFLFGFYRVGGSTLPADWAQRLRGDWRIESQAMGVLPAQRGKRLAYLLKWEQARQARQQGISLINWTADPLQFANASLNFGLLRAVAFDFYPDLYPFRNELNQAPASRFGLTWLVNTPPVRALSPQGAPAVIVDLQTAPAVQRINQGVQQIADPTADKVAIEIPADWNTLQRTSPQETLAWRSATDALFAQYIGGQPGQYVVTGVGVDADRRFLIAEKASDSLWEKLS